jgi:RNA polymerase sigma-70 factor (ECF subfamily)
MMALQLCIFYSGANSKMDSLDKGLLENPIAGETFSTPDRRQSAEFVVPFAKDCETTPEETAEQIEGEVIDLVHKHTAALSRFAGTMTRDSGSAQDGIQEAFFRYFIARGGGLQVGNPRAWLFKVLRNYLLDCKRKKSLMPAAAIEAAAQVPDNRQDVETDYQENQRFLRALDSLSPRERECMQLRIEGFGYAEIAQILNIRSGTVAALLARGLKKLKASGFFTEK